MRSEFDKLNEDDSESLFDFLNDDDGKPIDGSAAQSGNFRTPGGDSVNPASEAAHKGKHSANDSSTGSAGAKPRSASASQSGQGAGAVYPVIRKPVRVQQSGPLRPPRPGDPIEPPPPLTTAAKAPIASRSVKDDQDIDLDELDLNLNDDWSGNDEWASSSERPVPVNYEPARTSVLRKVGYVFATVLVLTGISAVVYSLPVVKQYAEEPVNKAAGSVKDLLAGFTASESGSTDDESSQIAVDGSDSEAIVDSTTSAPPSSLYQRFQDQLTQLESLLDQGSLDEATSVLQNMDRAVYGYGSQEFTAIEERLNNLKAGGVEQPSTDEADTLAQADLANIAAAEQAEAAAEAERLAQQRAAEEQAAATAEAARVEQQRVAEEQAAAAQAARLEQQRVAEEQAAAAQAARLEQQRVAEEQAAAEAARLEQQRVAEEQAAAEAARLEQQRVAEEQAAAEAARLEQQRVAEEQAAAEAARLEQQRVAEEQAAAEAARLEQQRVAEQQAAETARLEQQEQAAAEAAEREAEFAEAARLEQRRSAQSQAAEQAASLEQATRSQQQRDADERATAELARVGEERRAQERARQEQLQSAARERQNAQAQQNGQSGAAQPSGSEDWQAIAPAQGNQSVQDLAARQREQARQQRLLEARQRAEQTGAATGTVSPGVAVPIPEAAPQQDNRIARADTSEPVQTPQRSQPAPITDQDLRQVYERFTQLEQAIETRNIDGVLRLTRRSGLRIQQVMQMFENNVAITASLGDVSTLDSAGEIRGTLRITRLERADGSITGPPLNFSSVRLTSAREDGGWSTIRW